MCKYTIKTSKGQCQLYTATKYTFYNLTKPLKPYQLTKRA